jgi:small-conductance mechanosensitive channel/CRP-like cAMP-binding protein
MTHSPAILSIVDWLRAKATLFEGGGFLAVMSLLVFLACILPGHRRTILRGPAVFLGLYPLLSLLRNLFPEGDPLYQLMGYVALYFFLSSLGRTLFLAIEVLVLEPMGRPLPKIALDLTQLGILLAMLLAVLHEAGVSTPALLTGSALVTAGLSIALRDTLGNLAAGLTLQMKHPFEVGDWIQFDDKPHHIGRVTEINWRETRIVTLDEAEVILPNGQLANAWIRNFTKPEPWSRRSLYVVAPYDVPPNRIQKIILDAIADGLGVMREPPPSVVTNAFTDRGVEYWVRFFTTEFGRRDRVDGEVRDRIWYALARHGIEIPVATHAVRVAQMPTPEPEPREAALTRRMRLLERIDVFGVLPEPLLRQLAGLAREQVFGRGEVILRQGDPGESLYLIERGEVVVTAAANGQLPVEISRLGPIAFFGEMSLLTGAARAATVTAGSECLLLSVDKPAFEAVLRQSPDLAEGIGRVLTQRREFLAARLAELPLPLTESKTDFFTQIREFFSLT